ncbi:MAG: hypothetical protein AB1589_11165 [Cyanobacteriota bacterium]
MLVLPGYQTLAQIYESANSLVYGAIRTPDAQPVILKLLKQDYPTPEELVHPGRNNPPVGSSRSGGAGELGSWGA